MPVIQITNTYNGEVLDIVKSCTPEGFTVRTLSENSQSELLSKVSDADYILASGRVKITREILDRAEKLKMIQRTGVGLDSLDVDAIRAKGIPLYVNQGVNAQSVAEHTILLILACLRKLTLIDSNSKKGIWRSKEQAISTCELSGKTVGIIGLGSIGRKVSGLIRAFGAESIYYDAFRADPDVEKELGIQYVTLDELFSRADIITLHCPMTSETREMINKETLSRMKKGVIIVNTGRGGLIDEDALFEAIRLGKVGFAGLDVHSQEPYSKEDLLIMSDHVIATPHIAGVTYDSFSKMISDAMRNIALYEKGELKQIEEYLLK